MRTLWALFLCFFVAAEASAVVGVVRTFNAGKVVRSCSGGGSGKAPSCYDTHCNRFRSNDAAPKECYDVAEVEVVPADTYKKEFASSLSRIAELENQLTQYRQEVARSQNDVIETMINDPQFRSLLIKKIKEDSKR